MHFGSIQEGLKLEENLKEQNEEVRDHLGKIKSNKTSLRSNTY